MNRGYSLLALVCLVIYLPCSSAQADTLLDNLAEPDLCGGGSCYGVSDDYWGARQFMTDGNAWTVDELRILASSVGPFIFVAIYNDAGGVPGAQIGTLPAQSGVTELGLYDAVDFTADGSIVLAGNTKYWFVFGLLPGGFNRHFQQTNSINNSGPFTIQSRAAFQLSGPWQSLNSPSAAIKFRIKGTLVGPDCNSNAISDTVDISDGTSIDCDNNGVPDDCELQSGAAFDCNCNGIPDKCDVVNGLDANGDGYVDSCILCAGDTNCDGIVNYVDALNVLQNLGTSEPLGDTNYDGVVNFIDYLIVAWNYGTACD